MKNMLVKLLSLNPLLSLALVAGYIALLWYVAVLIWGNGHEIMAIVFVLSISYAVKSQSKGLIVELKRVKAIKVARGD